MKLMLSLLLGVFLCAPQLVIACGGSGGQSSSGFASRSTGGGQSISISNATPYNNAMGQIRMAQQAAAASASAYNAKMRPIRIANAQKVREQKLARREAFKQTMLARSESKKRAEQEFLAKARQWVDASGKHKMLAIVSKATDWGVQLKKQDGSIVNVPMERLSHDDRYFVADLIGQPEFETMLAGL